VAADAAVCCSGDAKVFQHLKTSYAIDIAATAMLGFHNMSVFVDRDVVRYVDLCQGSSLSRLELEDDGMLTWKKVSVCYLVVVPVKLIVAVGR